jgi:predicted membrane channel-forming protein YqfA (hemolysin III family)
VAEDRTSKLDRELIELLNELRVALPGVQVLFAFLLTVPFSTRFKELSTLQRNAYFAAFLFTTAASILLMTPSAYHRLRWRRRDKEHILVFSNRVTIAGLVFLAVAIALVVFVVADVVFDARVAGISGGVAAAAVFGFWFLIPLVRAEMKE